MMCAKMLQAISKGNAEKKLRDSTPIITGFASEKFGCVVVRQKSGPRIRTGERFK